MGLLILSNLFNQSAPPPSLAPLLIKPINPALPTVVYRDRFLDPISEGTTRRLTFQLVNESGDGINPDTLDTLTLTLYEMRRRTIINSRDDQDIKNANNVTIDTSGNLAFELLPADTAMIGNGTTEKHVALFEWTWNAGARKGRYEIIHTIENLVMVP